MQHGPNHAPHKSLFRLCGRLFVPGSNRAAFSGQQTARLNGVLRKRGASYSLNLSCVSTPVTPQTMSRISTVAATYSAVISHPPVLSPRQIVLTIRDNSSARSGRCLDN